MHIMHNSTTRVLVCTLEYVCILRAYGILASMHKHTLVVGTVCIQYAYGGGFLFHETQPEYDCNTSEPLDSCPSLLLVH